MLIKELLESSPVAKITFTLPKKAIASAKEVRVVGDFNDWDWEKAPAMKASNSNFTLTLILTAGKQYQFRYLADNGIWENDWAADDYITTPNNVRNSVVVVPAAKGE